MSKTIVAQINEGMLSCTTEHSDRYIYSNYFVPLLVTFKDDRTPVLPFYTKQKILESAQYGIIDPDRLQIILRELGFSELWNMNAMAEARVRLEGSTSPTPDDSESRRAGRDLTNIGGTVREATKLLEVLSPKLQEEDREILSLVSRRLSESTHVLLKNGGATGQGVLTEGKAVRPTVLGQQDVEFIAGLLQSDIGIVFLDRTRIRPVGFALGEHIYALALAPGEEVTLEQKTFTKRQVTFEEQSEQERQFDIELASTYSTEIQESFQRQHSLSDAWGLNLSHTGQYQSPQFFWGQFNASHTIAYTKNVTDANQETASRSVKDSQTASSKVSAKYRTLHKTTFQVVSEQSFEVKSKRTIRNPNQTTPLTLHYFKVLQRLKMMQERYGVRLCWAPSVKDPAFTFFEKIRKGRQHILDEAMKNLPPQPIEPAAPSSSGAPTSTTRETKSFISPIKDADKWNALGGQGADYDTDIPYDNGYTWDGNVSTVEASINVITDRPKVSRGVKGIPYVIQNESGNNLRVCVHIGASEWLRGPGIKFQVGATFYKDVTITQQAGENTKYNDDLADYRTRLKAWTDQRDATLAAANEAADAFEKRMADGLSPLNEMISQIIEQHFPPSVRDECWEIDYWQRLFDWERASFIAYPSWWSSGETRNPILDPSDFINASWAKLYLPVKVGMERFALRWIFGKTLAVPLAKEVESRFDVLVDDLRKFRLDELGAVDEVAELTKECQEAPEKYRCLATWIELMPTDGTHVEVVQGVTNAADAIKSQEIADAARLREAELESEKQSARLKDKAHDQMTHPATIEVHVGTSDSPSRGQS